MNDYSWKICLLVRQVPVWVNAPVASHREVWATFENFGGWSNMGISVLAGQLTGISGFAGLDAVRPDFEHSLSIRRLA
jgi:uncharacterized membrane protein YkvI